MYFINYNKGFSVSNATLNRFFSLHYLLPFILAALVVAHLISLHWHGSNNPNGIASTVDRYAFHPYFTFKDLVTIFAFLGVLSILVFFYPNVLGHSDLFALTLALFIISGEERANSPYFFYTIQYLAYYASNSSNLTPFALR